MSQRISEGVFPPISSSKRYKTEQEYTAIRVDSPKRREIPRTPPDQTQYVSESPQVPNISNAKLDQLAARQDQLYEHQLRVANNQDKLAQQMTQQNNAMNQALIKQAFDNKDQMIEELSRLRDSQMEDHTRDLLSQHIKYMVAIVQRLNCEIEGLEAEIHTRDRAVVGTNSAVNKLEVHHVTMLHDLRGRIVRCDTSIAKHSKDILFILEEIRRLEGLVLATREKLTNDIHRLEAEVISMTSELERQAGDQRTELTHLRKDALHRIETLEDRSRQHLAEVRDMVEGQKSGIDHRMDRMETKFQAMINKATDGWGNVMGQVDKKIEASNGILLSRLHKLEDGMANERSKLKNLEKLIENRVMAAIQSSMGYHEQELARAKAEFREGFTDIHDSISNAKRVVEGRRKLLATQLRKEIGQIRKRLLLELPALQDGETIIYSGTL